MRSLLAILIASSLLAAPASEPPGIAQPASPPHPGAAGEDRDLALLTAEIRLEMDLQAAGSDADSLLPLPEPAGAPAIDGSPDEPFWGEASQWRWKVPGDSIFLEPLDWRILFARTGGGLALAGRRGGTVREAEVLTIDAGPRRRLVIRLGPEGGGQALAEGDGAIETVEHHGASFAVHEGPDGVAWELLLSAGFAPFPVEGGGIDSLRLTLSRGHPAGVRVSPALRLLPADLALRALDLQAGAGNAVSLEAEVVNLSAAPLTLTLALNRQEILGPFSRRTFRRIATAPGGSWGVGWPFQAAPSGGAFRLGTATLFPDAGRLAASTAAVLDAAEGNLSRLPEGGGALRSALDRARAHQASEPASPQAAEEAWLGARLLRRKAFLAGAAARLGPILIARRHHDRAGPYYTAHLNDLPGGNLTVVDLRTGGERDLLELPPGASVRDPCLSFDARKVVFSLRSQGGGTGLHTVGIDGAGLKRITGGDAHDLEPCWAPGGGIIFVSTRGGLRNPLNRVDALSLHAVREDGTGLRRLGANYLADVSPSILPDGRVAFLRWVHEDKPGNLIHALWTMRPDGAEPAGLFGMHLPGVHLQPRAIPGTTRIVCLDAGEMGLWRDPLVGAIGIFDPDVDQDRFLYSIQAPRGGFRNPFPVGPDTFLAACGAADTRWGICLADRWGNLEMVHRDLELSCFSPIPVEPMPEPRQPSRLASPETGFQDAEGPAVVLVQDVYQGLPGVPPGTVKALRVVAVPGKPAGRPEAMGESSADQATPVGVAARMVRRVLGTVPVHSDGSAFFHAPAGTSLFFQVLDGRGLMVQTMRDVLSFAPLEFRACIGCHEPRGATPPRGRRGRVEALDGPAVEIVPEPGPASISFPRDIQPILDRRCVRCHDARDPAGRTILSGDLTPFFNLAYETLTHSGAAADHQGWTVFPPPGPPALAPAIPATTEPLPPLVAGARTSRLLALIADGHGDVALEPEELALLARWMDLNVPYYGDWEEPRRGGERRLLPASSERTIAGALQARCRGCHPPPDLFRGAVLDLTRARLSPILRAPLAREAGGWGLCGGGLFEGEGDPAYRAILGALETAGQAGAGKEGR